MDFLFPLRKLHGNIYDYFFYKKERKPLLDHFKKEFKKNINTVFLFMSPNYGNIGDHAIAYAEILFLEELGFNVIEITCDEVFDLIRFNLFKYINGHNIIITGGGFLGTLWFGSEKIVREIIKRTPKSKIVLMPNTIFYESSDWGIKEKIESTVLYNKHKHLYLYAREKESYHLMKSLFKNVELCPDMALFLNASKSNTRKGCLVCLRNDKEKNIPENSENHIMHQIETIFGQNVRITDTCVPYDVPINKRKDELFAKLDEFSTAELVVTDRLHGMIISAITGTPCIVLNSKSPKIKGCYEWIKDLEYIVFLEDPNEFTQTFKSIPIKTFHYNNSHLVSYYKKLAQNISNIFNKH